MSMAWLDWSNPVAIWWSFLLIVSAVNIAALLRLHGRFRAGRGDKPAAKTAVIWIEPLLLLCAVYVFGCAFRSVLPRADVQRICLFDTWLSSVMIGRSVATVAELCFAAQWAIVLYALGKVANSDTAKNIAKAIVPTIVLAEICSWYAVITTNFLGNVLENSLWTITFLFIGIALSRLVPRFRGPAQFAIAAAAAGIAAYVVFMATVDVPMYFGRWQADLLERQGLSRPRRRPARRRNPLDRHPRHRPMARRDRLDVALFQHGGVGEPGAGGLWSGEAPIAALSRAGAAIAGYAAAGRGEGAVFVKPPVRLATISD